MNLQMIGGIVGMGLVTSTTAVGNLLDSNPASPTYNNPSFESPDVPGFGTGAQKWVADGPLIDPGTGPILAGCGLFDNVADDPGTPGQDGHLNNTDGLQAAYLFSRSFPDAITGQLKDHSFTQVTHLTFQAGAQYQLSVGVANAQSAPPPDSTLTISLFAPVDGGGEIPLGSTDIRNDGVTSPALNGLAFVDFFATTGPIGGDAAGRPIGIRFKTSTPPTTPSFLGQFDLDDVQLTIVPEPAGLALFAGAGRLLAARSRRR